MLFDEAERNELKKLFFGDLRIIKRDGETVRGELEKPLQVLFDRGHKTYLLF